MLRNLFEAFIYAVFPIVFLLLMLPSAARMALTYLKAVVWIQLWAPLYAVLHFATTLFSQSPAEAALLLPDGSTVLSLSNFTGLRQVMADTALIAGYLSLSIPMISYLVVNQGGAMIANLATRVGQSYEAPVGKGAEEATTGNIRLGTTSLGKADWWAQNTSPSWRSGVVTHQDPNTGATVTETGGGVYAVQRLASDVGVQIGARQVADYVEGHALRDAQSARFSAGSSYTEAIGSVFSQGPSFSRQAVEGGQYQSLMQSSEGRQFQETLQKLEPVQDSLQDATRAEEQWQSALTREKALEETYQRLQRWSESIDGDFTQGFVQHLRNETVTGERWLEDRLRAGDSGAIMRVAAIWAAGEDVAGAIKPASLLTREDVRPRPVGDTRDEVEHRLDGGVGAVAAEQERMRSTAERSARVPNEHFDENSELVETQGSVLDLADRNGLPAATVDRGVERRVEGGEQEANESLKDARETREYKEDLLQTRHDFATRHGAARTTFTHGSVRGDATEGLPPVDEGVAGDIVTPSHQSPGKLEGPPTHNDSSDHLDHVKLSRIIPGYVKPDGTKPGK